MLSPLEVTLIVAAVGAGLVGGLCFAFATFIMDALNALEAPEAIRAMQAINTHILRSSAMVVWFGTAIVGALAVALASDRTVVFPAALLYVLAALAITGRGNVPLNQQLDRVDPTAPDAAGAWEHYRTQWNRWNAIRTILCILACAGFAAALIRQPPTELP